MSLAAFGGPGTWVGSLAISPPSVSAGAYVLDASGEYAALVMRCPKAGTIDRFDFSITTVTNSPDNGLRASIQGVSEATGLPDGTILGATNNAFVTYAHTVTTGWKSTNFGETVTVTRGQLIALVVDIPSFTASDSISLTQNGGTVVSQLPYGVNVTGTKQASHPLFVPHYTDGYALPAEWCVSGNTWTNPSFHVDTAGADEYALAFQVPVPCRLDGAALWLAVAAGADFEVILYNAADVALSTVTFDGDVTSTTSHRTVMAYLAAAVTLTPNVVYRLAVRPTTTNALQIRYLGFASLDLMAAMPGGSAFYLSTRVNQGGAWTDYNSATCRQPAFSLLLSAFDNAAQNVVTNVFSSPIVRPVEGE